MRKTVCVLVKTVILHLAFIFSNSETDKLAYFFIV